jgi:hypothetical protein
MTQLTPTFNPNEFELRGYTNPYLTDVQKTAVTQVEDRVSGELDFVAQMLGWSGPNYWTHLATTVSEKRQLLVGTYGVYNNFILPRIYEIRNWDNTIVIDRLPLLSPDKSVYAEYVLLGEDKYQIQSITTEGDRYVVSLGVLPDSFYTQIANNVPLLVNIPSYRPAPFVRGSVGVSGDGSFVCSTSGTSLILYPAYDTEKKFPYRFPVLFAGSTYYFDQPVYLSYTSTPSVDINPEYDADLGLWYLQIPANLTVPQAGLTSYLVWAYSDPTTATNALLEVKIQPWVDPSDWGTESVLQNFRGVWNNKGGDLPYNLVFDSLSIHGFNEKNSLYFPSLSRILNFNDLVSKVYSQLTTISEHPPGVANSGDLWWNSDTGVLAVWIPQNDGCSAWVEVDYRVPPEQFLYGDVLFANVAAFIAGASTVPQGTQVSILDITGLSVAENVLGVQGTLTSPATLTLYQEPGSQYWTPVEFLYLTVADFEADALNLPYGIPILIGNSDTLQPAGSTYSIANLKTQIFGDYAVVATKYYNNRTWEIAADSILKYIANSSLFGSPLQGEMWWDYSVPTPELRCASLYYGSAWVQVNTAPPAIVPAPFLDFTVLLFYCDGNLLTPSTQYSTDNYIILYTVDAVTGTYTFDYTPKNLVGKTQLPTITMSDNLTTTYQADITSIVFSGVQYYMSPNIYDAETPLRVWKAQDLQVAETVAHLAEDNYINPLRADLNNGPGPENWERYFVRLPLDYGRNETNWQKVVLTCQDFGYWGSPIEPEKMRCPPEDDLPAIYEELFLYDRPIQDYTYVYCEPYLYSNLAYTYAAELGDYRNAGVFPASDVQFDEFSEAELIDYEPLHNRQANFSLPVGQGYGNWKGDYVNINPCIPLTGFFTTDLINDGLQPVAPPVWDASIYKFAPTCENTPATYNVDANHYKVGYAYFVADASAAEDGFFDIQQEAAWRDPEPQSQSLYLLPR